MIGVDVYPDSVCGRKIYRAEAFIVDQDDFWQLSQNFST